MLKKILTSMLFVLSFLFLSYSEEMKISDIKEINFGIISTESTTNLKKGFDPFLADMEKALGIKVNAFFASDYAGVVEAMRFNKVQVAWFGNKSAMEAVDRANGEVFAQTTDPTGIPGYWSLIIVHRDSTLNTIEDVIKNGKDLNFGNGDVNSTSGYLIPGYYIWAKNGIDPNKHFKSARSANHEANILAVAMKQVDLATNNTENLEKFQREKPDLAKNVKIIWKSPLIPKDPFVWRKDLPVELKAEIKGFILSYGRVASNDKEVKRQIEVLKGMTSGMAPFLDSSNRQLIPIREIELSKDILKIEKDDKMDKNAKKTKIAELKKKLQEVKIYSELADKL
ncbi:MAG: phosphonate ABC transporter substrate-binding protein [Spirochaetes bacterium]|nr:phosphonate ABC transporter substrate-binding protein [Spirochaetota bacterium]